MNLRRIFSKHMAGLMLAATMGPAGATPSSPSAPAPLPAPAGHAASVAAETVRGIPIRDALMGVYAAYYIGAERKTPEGAPVTAANADLDGRATNVFNMDGALRDYFGRADSPFIVLDDSNRWNERHGRESLKAQREMMGGGYFVTLYHKASGRIMIAAPGLEGDTPGSGTANISQDFMGLASRGANDYGDVLFNAQDAYRGGTFLRMTRAMRDYIAELDRTLQEGRIHVDNDGRAQPLSYAAGETIRDRVVLAGHSAGTIPAMTLTGAGFKSFTVEPRAYDRNLEHRMMGNLAYMNEAVDPAAFRRNIEQGQTSLRASWPNVWTASLGHEGEFKNSAPGKNYVAHRIGTEKDTMIGGTHRVEVMVPGLLGMTEARGFKGHAQLIADALPGHAARNLGESLARATGPAPAASDARTPVTRPGAA